ncbi:SapC family protein [Psychrosphaera sp. F3M07]|uniref:SapC family protein n=1 Tax=Psychrosphaera sp. F3M07 TaxID=2841560 RepID=UPI001C07F40F|nr:SapC family protein [Psychrosphaera sp. F3M07]MBU2918835.1 SapC family protein [Psychrosphaera sp. F3M07]
MSKKQYELVNTEAHNDLKINHKNFNIKDNHVNACVVVASELSTLIHEYPIFITKRDDGNYQLTALLGTETGENLYLDGSKWRSTYIPLDILRKPFHAFIPDNNDLSKGSIAIDISSENVGDPTGELLFTANGETTDYFKRIESTFSQLMGGTAYTTELLKLASDLELLEQVSLNIDLPNGEKANINGLFTFDKQKVTALKGKALKQCHDSGILQICHLILSSSLHLQKLINWKMNK